MTIEATTDRRRAEEGLTRAGGTLSMPGQLPGDVSDPGLPTDEPSPPPVPDPGPAPAPNPPPPDPPPADGA